VFAGVRTLPLKPDEQLAGLINKRHGVVVPVLLTSAVEIDNRAAAQMIKEKIGKVDVASVTQKQIRSDFENNVLGPVVLFQAFEPLLSASDAVGGAKFIIISSVLGQITEASDYSYDAYGISKAGANFVAKKLSQENPGLIAFPMQ
jgi:norsolorinic acid ketoreductase